MPSVRVNADNLVLDLLRVAGELLFELGVAHYLSVSLQRMRNLLLLGRGKHGARGGQAGKAEGERGQHDGAGKRQPERQPERSGGRVYSRGLAYPLVRDRGECVVVELGHQQAQPAAGDHQRDHEPPAGVRLAALFPATTATANMVSESGASDRPAFSALYSSTICR